MTPSEFKSIKVSLSIVFGLEFDNRTPAEQLVIARDYSDAYDEDGCTVSEYRRRIGDGNLKSYVDVLAAGNRWNCGHRNRD